MVQGTRYTVQGTRYRVHGTRYTVRGRSQRLKHTEELMLHIKATALWQKVNISCWFLPVITDARSGEHTTIITGGGEVKVNIAAPALPESVLYRYGEL